MRPRPRLRRRAVIIQAICLGFAFLLGSMMLIRRLDAQEPRARGAGGRTLSPAAAAALDAGIADAAATAPPATDDGKSAKYKPGEKVPATVVVNGVNVGFRCVRNPTPELLAKCPWFRRS